MIRLKILNSYYKIIDGYNVSESSREVKFSDLKIDFTDKTIEDIPNKYQECQLLDIDIIDIPEDTGKTITSTDHTISIEDADTSKEVEITNMVGETSQNGTPTPSSPVEVKTTTGRQEIDVRGKNLLPFPYFTTSSPFTNNGITYTINNDGTINVNGTATGRSSMSLYGNYLVANQKDLTGRYIKGGTSNVNMYVFAHVGNQYPVLAHDTGQGAEIDKSNYQKGYIELVVTNGTTVNNELIKPMMLNSLDDTTYEEYKLQSYEINLGKNIFHQKETTLNNGITYTKNEDGSYNIKGTASPQANLYVDIPISQTELVSGQTYTFSCNKVFPNSMTIIVECYNGSTWLRNLIRLNAGQTTSTATIDLTNATFVRQTIRVYANQTIDIENLQIQLEKGSTKTSYSPYKKPIELCKIGTYQDRIYKENGKWYLEKQIGKVVLDGSETGVGGWALYNHVFYLAQINDYKNSDNIPYCNYYKGVVNVQGTANMVNKTVAFNFNHTDLPRLFIRDDDITSVADFRTWLSTHNTIVYYVLATPTTNEITDTELINQLESIELLEGINNISITSNNLGGEITIHYNFKEAYHKEIINKIIFTGYINTIVLPNMKNKEEYRELEIELLSPMALATRRTIVAIGNYRLKELIELILQPLYDDGFELKEFNVGDAELTVNYLIETVESSLNKLSNKYNFWWYIDENKNIFINSIDYQFNQKPKLIYNEDNKLNGLIDITPSIDATDYCNVVNFVNVRTWQYSCLGQFDYVYDVGGVETTKTYIIDKDKLFNVSTIKNEDEIIFNHPVDITLNNITKSNKSNFNHRAFTDYQNYALLIKYTYSDNTTGQVYIRANNGVLQISNNATLEETPEITKEFEFKRDSFFNNLITGFKYNNANKSIKSIETLFSCSALMWTRLKINNLSEIQKSKGKVSTSGQIEKTIDMNEQWKTLDDLQLIGNAYIKANSNQANSVTMTFDVDHNLSIGDIIKIECPHFLINNSYIITDMNRSYINKNDKEYKITLRNSNYFESYVDLFRAKETEEIEEKNYNLSTIDYEEGTIKEVHEVV